MKIPKQISTKTFLVSTLLMLLAGSIVLYVIAQTPTQTVWISEGIYVGSPDYTVWREGSYYYAKNYLGRLVYAGSNASDLVQDVVNVADGTVYFKKGTYAFDSRVRINVEDLHLLAEIGTIITSSITTNYVAPLRVSNARRITIENFIIQDSTGSAISNLVAGIRIEGNVEDITVKNCWIDGFYYGIYTDSDEGSLRPPQLSEFIGQKDLKKQIGIYIKAALGRNENLDHVLLYGPPGLGKTTLATIISHELGVGFKATSAPAIERSGDLAAILSSLKFREVLFIDEIHRLKAILEEILYPALEDYTLDIVIGQGPGAKSIKISLQPFTLIGATTKAGLLSAPLRARFGITQRIDFYNTEEIFKVVKRSARILNIEITEKGAMKIAQRSRGTPRVSNRILRRLRDIAEVEGNGYIDEKIAVKGLEMLNLDHLGLDTMDKRLIDTIISKYDGGPVGIETLAVSIGEDKDSIEDIYEPYLIQIGFIKRTQKGRVATKHAYDHFGFQFNNKIEGELF